MLSEKMQAALNDQLNAELYSAYLYVSMSAYFEDSDLPGFAHWMRSQAQEEMIHAQKFYTYLHDRDGRVLLGSIEGPPTSWESPEKVFEAVLEHEKHVTSLIHKLVDLAEDERDRSTDNFLQWFVAEQVEEEATAKETLQKVRMVSASPGGIYLVDRELAARPAPVTVPAAAGE